MEKEETRTLVRDELQAILHGYSAPPPTILGTGADEVVAVRQYLELLSDGGWIAPQWPKEFGGRGASNSDARIIREALALLPKPDVYPFQVGLALAGPSILRWGTDEQKARWLPRIISGQDIWCQLFSEPGAGSDLAALRCKAVRDGDGWRLTGNKVWSSRAHYANRGILLARFDDALPKREGIIAFALDMNAAGVEVRPLKQMNGDTHFNEVFLEEAYIADTDRIGEPGQGWDVALGILTLERQAFGGEGSGTGVGVRRKLVDLLHKSARGSDPVLVDRTMQVWIDLHVAKLAGERAGALASARNPEAATAAAGAKLRMARNLRNVADVALTLRGAEGTIVDDTWSGIFLTAPSMSIRGGTDEVQRNSIGERILGLPREPRMDDGPFTARRVAE